MKLLVLEINEDGSANCEFDLTQEELISMAKVGIIAALTEAVNKMEKSDEGENRQIL